MGCIDSVTGKMSEQSRQVILNELFGEGGGSALLAFVRTARDGSFARAAERLGISASGVAKAVQRIEARLGRRLFARTTRSLSLTEAGALLLEHAERILDSVAAAESALSEADGAPRGPLRVSLAPGIGRAVLLPALAGFLRRYPGVRLDVVLDSRTVDLVAEGFDLALRTGDPTDSSLRGRRLGSDAAVLVAAPSYLVERGNPRHAGDLSAHACIRYRNPTTGRVQPWPLDADVPATVCYNDYEAIRLAASTGQGIALVAACEASAAIGRGELATVLDGALPADRRMPVWLLWPPDRHALPKVRVFVDFVADVFRQRLDA
jgi:DNA-binding transcriptional LysR family regulator